MKKAPKATLSLKARNAALAGAGFALLALMQQPATADGDLSTKPEELETLVLGTDPVGFAVSVKEYNLRTGQAYSLPIKSSGYQEYAVVAPEFFRDIWLRKVEAGGMEIKAGALHELEFEDEGEAEIFFVPIKPGTFELYAKGLKEKGTVVTINVK